MILDNPSCLHLASSALAPKLVVETRRSHLGQASLLKGKGQLPVLIGAIYRGSKQHVALKAGGNDEVQLKVAQQGVVTTSEKYIVAHSAHVSIRFAAVTWNDLPPITPRETGDDDSDNVSYRQPRNSYEEPNDSGDSD